jgi:hypothetical protein
MNLWSQFFAMAASLGETVGAHTVENVQPDLVVTFYRNLKIL